MDNYRCVTSVQEIQKYIGNATIVPPEEIEKIISIIHRNCSE